MPARPLGRAAWCSLAVALATSLPVPVAAQIAPPPVLRPPRPGEPLVLPKPTPIVLEVGVRLGGVGRVGSSQAFDIDGRGGVATGVSVYLDPSPRFGIGLLYEHVGLGTERGEGELGSIELSRRAHTLWASARVNIVRTGSFDFALALGPGLVWQNVDALVIETGAASVRTFGCSASASVGFGLRATAGIAALLGSGVWFTLDAGVDNLRLTSDLLGGCVVGAGTTTLVGARAGIAYRFDVTRLAR